MSQIQKDKTIDYLELPVSDFDAEKRFFADTFGWKFQDYGPDYCSFDDGRTTGGFFKSNLKVDTSSGSVLIVFYAEDLEGAKSQTESNGGQISKDIFSFPGGRRFHFLSPSGNEFAVWSDK